MQELRFVLIIVGIVAIAALLFHGLWTSKRDGKTKFADKPLGKMPHDEELSEPQRGFQAEASPSVSSTKSTRKEPDFSVPQSAVMHESTAIEPEELSTPSFSAVESDDIAVNVHQAVETQSTPEPAHEPMIDRLPTHDINAPQDAQVTVTEFDSAAHASVNHAEQAVSEQMVSEPVAAESVANPAPAPEPEMQVMVLHVHCAQEQFVGTSLFASMQKQGLIYGEMDIFHCHKDGTPASAVLFSVANIMAPGTLKHDDPATFTTKGISFFMTLPCNGDAGQNFKQMLRTAQVIANDLGGHVLDDARNYITPNRIDAYHRQIQDFKQTCNA